LNVKEEGEMVQHPSLPPKRRPKMVRSLALNPMRREEYEALIKIRGQIITKVIYPTIV